MVLLLPNVTGNAFWDARSARGRILKHDPGPGPRGHRSLDGLASHALLRSALALICTVLIGVSGVSAQYQSDDPSDATTGLPYSLNTGGEIVLCTLGSQTMGGTLTAMTSTPSAVVLAPLCGAFTPGSTADAWYRLDVPATGDNRFRFTVMDGPSNPLTNGALAAYSAPSAAGPFQLLDCSHGGSLATAANPTLEVNSAPPGSKIYIRVWDEVMTTGRNFSLCVQGQLWSDLATRQYIADTPCDVYTTPTPPTILVVGAAAATYYNSFARTENFPFDPSCGNYRGGDVWFRTTVPASGALSLSSRNAANTGRRIARVGFSMYTSSASCSDYTQFNEVSCVTATLTTTLTVLSTVNCLTPGSYVWIRAYATIDSQSSPSRYGAFQLRVTDPAGTAGVIANNLPCGATPLTIGTCPAYNSGTAGFNVGACFTPGVPAPGCGTISASTPDVWFRFTAPANGTVSIRVNGDNSSIPAFDPATALYTTGGQPCNGPLTLVDCDNKHASGQGALMLRTGLEPGQTYYLRVWGEGTSGLQTGIFYVCISSPVPPPGYCYYMLQLTHVDVVGSQTIRVAIGTDTTDYTTNGDPSERILVAVPSGVSVTFLYYNSGLAPGAYTYSVYRFGEPTPLWTYTGGIAVIGPSPGPTFQHVVTTTCLPIVAAREDCLGSTTICGTATINSQTSITNGQITDLAADNRGCLGSNEVRGGRWFVFRAQANGQISFTLRATVTTTDDLDFAVWDAGATPTASLPFVSPSVCAPVSPPIRCSSARVNGPTGLLPYLPNRFSEGTGGFGWLSPLTVQADHVYMLYVVNTVIGTTPRDFQVQWTQLLDEFGAPDNTILDCDQLILPVELITFDAKPMADDVLVSWSTATEKNSDHFIVERARDASTFAPIGVVDAAGFAVTRHDYGFTDTDPFLGANYYRLCQVDQDGVSTYSDIAVVNFDRSGKDLLVFPNPAYDNVQITSAKPMNGSVTFSVVDATGRVALSTSINADEAFQTSMDVSGLANGVYVILATSSGTTLGTARFVKR